MNKCIVCEDKMVPLKAWLYVCPSCRFLRSDLKAGAGRGVDGLETLRKANFQLLISHLKKHLALENINCLEVGAAEGWFMEAMAAEGARLCAIEPSEHANELQRKGFKVSRDFFPQALAPGEKYDLIVFNDVFEHLPDPVEALAACEKHLNDGGILVINLPNSRGFFYRVASLLDKAGIAKPLDRLCQKGLPSPHITYWSETNMPAFISRHSQLNLVHRLYLPSLAKSGLRQRIQNSYRGIAGHIVYTLLLVMLPLCRLLPQDIMVFFFQKNGPQDNR